MRDDIELLRSIDARLSSIDTRLIALVEITHRLSAIVEMLADDVAPQPTDPDAHRTL